MLTEKLRGLFDKEAVIWDDAYNKARNYLINNNFKGSPNSLGVETYVLCVRSRIIHVILLQHEIEIIIGWTQEEVEIEDENDYNFTISRNVKHLRVKVSYYEELEKAIIDSFLKTIQS